MAFSFRRGLAIASGILIWLAALLQALQAFGATGGPSPPQFGNYTSRSSMQSLNYSTLEQFWAWKRSQLGVDVTIDLFTSAGLIGIAYCVLILKRIFRRYKNGDSDLPGFMSACFFIGSILPSVQLLQMLGSSTTSDLISDWSQLPPEGLQMLYITYLVVHGSGTFLFGMQFLFVSFGLFVCSFLSFQTHELPSKHAVLGFIASFFGFLTFILDIVIFNATKREAFIAFGVFLFIYGVILLPIWIIWLGVELRILKRNQQVDNSSGLSVNLNDLENRA